jgi:hypothetical protein
MINTIRKNYFRGEFVSYTNTDYQAIQEWIAEGGEVIDNPPE